MSSIAPPEWVQKPDLESQLEEGHAGYLHCYARATPDPEVTWYRSTQPITAEVSGKTGFLHPEADRRAKANIRNVAASYLCVRRQ